MSFLARAPRFVGRLLLLLAATCTGGESLSTELVQIKIHPTVRRSIAGVGRLDRDKYFAISDHGARFLERLPSDKVRRRLFGYLHVRFGRSLGPIKGLTRREGGLREDPARPGFADIDHLIEQLQKRPDTEDRRLTRLIGNRADIAAHGSKGEFPDFMGQFTTPQADKTSKKHHPEILPANRQAAAELAAAVLEHGYDDFLRPSYYEPINEPHWSYHSTAELAEWHRLTHAAVRQRELNVQVGGPCLSVAYFYRNNYRAFNGLKDFIRNTGCELDFYSFHVYDYLNWNGQTLAGRVTSGLPIEGVLDLVQCHTHNEYGKQVQLVFSEHGGYVSGSKGPSEVELGDLLAKRHRFPEQGFDLEMRKRSIANHVLVSAAIANTLAFVEHPHVVAKAVPFILLESMAWDPKYYSTLYVPHDFEDRERWVASRNGDFYEFFRDLRGERVYVRGGDPDLQTRAFVQDNVVRVVINNLSDAKHVVQLSLPSAESHRLRRYGRAADFTPYLREEALDFLTPITLAGREAVMLIAEYNRPIPAKLAVEETPHYGDRIAQPVESDKQARFVVDVPAPEGVAYASLRIGVTRPSEAPSAVRVLLNGKQLRVPLEETAPRLADPGKEYATTKILEIAPASLRKSNRVEVSFEDNGAGAIGSVVIRAGRKAALR